MSEKGEGWEPAEVGGERRREEEKIRGRRKRSRGKGERWMGEWGDEK